MALGISVQNATANDAEYVGLPEIRGVLVQDFSAGSPAKKAGIEAGDIIVSVDGNPVEYVGQLQQQIAFRKAGDKVKVEVARKGGVRKTLEVGLQAVAGRPGNCGRDRDATDQADNSSGDAAAGYRSAGPDGAAGGSGRGGAIRSHAGSAGTAGHRRHPRWAGVGRDRRAGQRGSRHHPVGGGQAGEERGRPQAGAQGFKKDDIVSLRIYNTQAKSHRIERIRLGE